MKKIIVLLAIVGLFISTPALAGSINVFGTDRLKQIYVTDDNGYLRTYTSHKVGDNTRIIYDNQTGMSTMVHDYSTDPAPEKESDFFDIPDLLD